MAYLYHLALAPNWHAALADGRGYRISSIDQGLEEVGFIHCSYAEQLQATADRFYRGHEDVLLLVIDPDLVDVEIRVELAGTPPSGFPHLYGPLNTDAVIEVRELALDADGRVATGF